MVLVNLVNPYYLLFLPAIPDPSRIPEARASVNRKIMADFRHSSVEYSPGRALRANCQLPKSLIYWESLVGVWEFHASDQGPVRPLSTGYPHLTVDNSSGVWEF